jgi:plasmid stability protein
MSKTIQIRNVPEDVHRELKVRAAQARKSLSELVLAELIEIARRPTMAEWLERVASREPVLGPESSADLIRAGRAEREAEMESWLGPLEARPRERGGE